MKKVLLFGTALCVATSVWAFGGVGIFGHKSHHSSGVNSIGVHYNGPETEQPIFVEPECNVDEDCDIYAQKCVNGTCESVCDAGLYMGEEECLPVSEGNCNKNADCNAGEYCEIQADGGGLPTSGLCQSVANNSLPVSWNNQGFVRSLEQMSWWSADNFCRAQGKYLVHLRNLGMTRPEGWCDWESIGCAGLTPEEWDNLVTSLHISSEEAESNWNGIWICESNGYGNSGYIEVGGAIGDYTSRDDNNFALCK